MAECPSGGEINRDRLKVFRLLFMKATLEFSLPDDDEALTDARQGSDWKRAVDDLFIYLRNQIKHGDHTAEEYNTFERVRSKLIEVLDERGLSIHG